MESAIKDIKEAAPQFTWVQNAKMPETAGGHVDVLIGIKYNCLFPIPRFSLECGLTIYELRLSGIKGYNAVIGGPHESFNFMLKNAGENTDLWVHLA